MYLTAALALMLTIEPWVMTAQPGDTVRAELAVGLEGTREEQARRLLGDVAMDMGEFTVGDTTLAYAGEAGGTGPRPVVIFAPHDAPHPDRACIVSPTGETANNNSQRALTWCHSFLVRGLVVELSRPRIEP